MDIKDECKLKVKEFHSVIKTDIEDCKYKFEKSELKPDVLIQLFQCTDDYKPDSRHQEDTKHEDIKKEKQCYELKYGNDNIGFFSGDICIGEKLIIDTSNNLLSDTSENNGQCLDIDSHHSQVKANNPTEQTKTKEMFKQNMLGRKHIFNSESYNNYFLRKDNYVDHLEVHLEKRELKCTHCSFSTAAKSSLIKHMFTHGFYKNEIFNCSRCSYSSKSRCNFVVHSKVHLTINKCGEPQNKKKTQKKFKCAHCHYETKKKHSLTKHMSTHGFYREVFKCSYCKISYRNRYNLLRHLRTTHDRTSEGKYNSPPPFMCSTCNTTYGTSFALKRHSLIHLGELPYNCVYCDFATTRRYSLQKHLKKHDSYSLNPSGKQLLKIPRGTKSLKSSTKNNVEKEKKRNTATLSSIVELKRCKIGLEHKYPFRCATCGYRTSKRALLKYHIVRKHTKEPVFKCSSCDFSTYTTERFQQHRLIQKHDMFSCEHCSFTCFKYLMIQKHMKSHFSS